MGCSRPGGVLATWAAAVGTILAKPGGQPLAHDMCTDVSCMYATVCRRPASLAQAPSMYAEGGRLA